MLNNRSTSRIDFIDGLRAAAILLVIMFHYFSRWTPPLNGTNIYPYGGLLADFPLFTIGWSGVQLFFMISGFVIAMTLDKCKSFWEFAVRRYSRLAPAMLFFAILTFIAIKVIPGSPFDASWLDFLPSLTFIEPFYLGKLPFLTGVSTIDHAYWSLFVEVKFYAIAGTLYFLFGRRMAPLLTIIAVVLTILTVLDIGLLTRLARSLDMANYLPWFLIGIACYGWQMNQTLAQPVAITVISVAELVLLGSAVDNMTNVVIGIVLPIIFVAVFLSPILQRILANKYLVTIGASSYGLYLVHQNIGVSLIHALPDVFGTLPLLGVVAAILVAGTLTVFAHFSFLIIEKPVTRFLLRKML